MAKRGRRRQSNTLLAVLVVETLRQADDTFYKEAIALTAKLGFADESLVDNVRRYRAMRADVEKGRNGLKPMSLPRGGSIY